MVTAHIGPPPPRRQRPYQIDGNTTPAFSPATTTSSTVTGGNTGPELHQGGVPCDGRSSAAGTLIGAVQVAGGGYDVAWKDTGVDRTRCGAPTATATDLAIS